MKPILLTLMTVSTLAWSACGAGLDSEFVVDKDPFIPFAKLGANELMPKDATITFSKDGDILVNGKPRYLPATIFYEMTDLETEAHTVGYPDDLKWLYEQMPDYEAAQRLGFDALGSYATLEWMKLYRDGFGGRRQNPKQMERFLKSGLGIYVDYTASEWWHGSMFPGDTMWPYQMPERKEKHFRAVLHKPNSTNPIPLEAWTHGHRHWVPYSLVHPDGREIWYTLWREGAKSVLKYGVQPWCYELMNEPAYWEENEMTLRYFRERMRKEGKLELIKDTTAYNVEYLKFIEDNFAEVMAGGVEAIRQVDKNPEARFCFQPCTIRTRGIDLWKANKPLSVICAHTGARGVTECAILRGLADGKPIVDSEMYVGTTSNSIRSTFIQQYMRGLNVSYMFKWSRRPGDFMCSRKVKNPLTGREKWEPDVKASINAAKRMSAYNFMNPYKVPTDQLVGVRMAKRDTLDVEEFFTPRNRGVPAKIGVLFSSPTERLAYAAGFGNYKFFDAAVGGILFAHLPVEVVCEDDLERKLDRYRVLVLAGTDSVYDKTPALLERFVRNGGSLVMYGHAMEHDEYGRKPPRQFPGIAPSDKKVTSESEKFAFGGWQMMASAYCESVSASPGWVPVVQIAGKDAIFAASLGKGRMYFIGAKMPGESIGAFVAAVAGNDHGEKPFCSVKPIDGDEELANVEVYSAKRNGMDAYILLSHSHQGALRFFPKGLCKQANTACVRIRNFADAATREWLERGEDGSYIVRLTEDGPVILVFGTEAELRGRYDKTSADVRWLRSSWRESLAEARAYIKELESKRVAQKNFFAVDESRCRQLDLKPFANSRFVDRVAGDGKGGWTDQGIQLSLTDTPWGVVNCNGVPMEFIRYDQNGEKDCLVFGGSNRIKNSVPGFKGIPVEQRVGRFYFLHAVAWAKWNGAAFKYRINYGDGSSALCPVVTAQQVYDWYFLATTGEMVSNRCVKGWGNSSNRGFYLYCWENPHPGKLVSSIDIVDADPNQICLLAAITVEKPDGAAIRVDLGGKGVRPLCGKKGTTSKVLDGGIWEVGLDETASAWTSGRIEFPAVNLASNRVKEIRMKMNKAPDQWGKYFENPTPQFTLFCRDQKGQWFFTNYVVPLFGDNSPAYRADNDPGTWQEVRLPLDRFGLNNPKRPAASIFGLSLQYQQMPASERSGLRFKDIRFILGE
ncbi:MAG: hypothetical protein ACI4QD_07220 [Kiritimatiellia bacterium]